ncbi:S1 family peptidase [Streptomyces rugosispiralis]|uniref:Serine protease n=1 Tax=Streptomyces rugosispiralis TaxID=2967341 RepID=A0ABT1VDR9_9ACTN|nr:serine protease [Streptomyces rugosispiralis]MCQ8195118.1 serine protease [Streptomyces rugosispiralis]
MGAEMGITADATSSGGTWRVRIRSSAGDVLGAGVLLGSETVLTCAHVIPDDGLPVPATEVLVELVEVHEARPVPARVADGCWVPQRSDGCGDVALLRLGRPQPAEHAAPLYRLPPVLGRPVWMGGFPKGLDNGHYLRAKTAGRVGPRAEWVGLDPKSPRDVVRKGFSGAGVEDEATRHVIGMVVSRYDDPVDIPPAERLSVSYMIPVETIVRHLPVVHRWVRGDPGVDRPLVSPLTTGVQDIGFAQRLAVWLRREPLTGRAGITDVETVVIEDDDHARYEALSRAITLADRELSGGGPDEAVSAAPHGTVPPLGSVDLAIDVTKRTDTEVALRVADRMDLRSPGDTSPLSRVRANAVPLTIVAVGVDRARDPEALVGFMKLLADRGSRLLLVFRDPQSSGLLLAERLFRPEAARIDAWLDELAGRVALAADREHETAGRGARRSASSDAEDATALRINLTRLRSDPELRSHRIVAKLAAFEQSVRTVAERAEETLRVIDAQQPAVQELKWQLVSYTAMLGTKAESERAELIPLHRAAVRLLAEVPCDLPEARRAVDRFVAAVHTPPEGEAP